MEERPSSQGGGVVFLKVGTSAAAFPNGREHGRGRFIVKDRIATAGIGADRQVSHGTYGAAFGFTIGFGSSPILIGEGASVHPNPIHVVPGIHTIHVGIEGTTHPILVHQQMLRNLHGGLGAFFICFQRCQMTLGALGQGLRHVPRQGTG